MADAIANDEAVSLGQLDSYITIVARHSISASVNGGETNRIFSFAVPKAGAYELSFAWTGDDADDGTGKYIRTNKVSSINYNTGYSGNGLTWAAIFTAGDVIYIDMIGANNQGWGLYSSYVTLKRIGL